MILHVSYSVVLGKWYQELPTTKGLSFLHEKFLSTVAIKHYLTYLF